MHARDTCYRGASMPILTVRHVTTYHYRQPVAFGEHRMMLRPRDDDDQRVLKVRPRHLRPRRAGSTGRWTVSAITSRPRALPIARRSSLRKHDGGRSRAGRLSAGRYRGSCPDLSVRLRQGRRRPRPLHRAAFAARAARTLGVGVPARRRIGRHARAARRHDADHPKRIQAWRTAPEGHTGSAPDAGACEWKLPRSRGADDRRPAHARDRGALRVRVPQSRRSRRRPDHRRQHPRLGAGLHSGSRLGRLRSVERRGGQRKPRARRCRRRTARRNPAGRNVHRFRVGSSRHEHRRHGWPAA